MFGKQNVLASVQSYNLETMQSCAANLQAATDHTLQVASELGLTAQQGHNIATGEGHMACWSLVGPTAGTCSRPQLRIVCQTVAIGHHACACCLRSATAGNRMAPALAPWLMPSIKGAAVFVGWLIAGVELYLGLQEGIQQEQHRLQAALEAASSNCAADLNNSTAGLDSHAEQLEQQQELYQRMQSLLQKQYILQFVMIGWVVGCLSYEQLARANVLVWPYVIRYSHLGLGIQQWYRNHPQGKQGCSVKSSS